MMKKSLLTILLIVSATATYAQVQSDSLRLGSSVAPADSVIVVFPADSLSRPSANEDLSSARKSRKIKVERPAEWTDDFLDTVDAKKAFVMNDYSMVGIHYGVSFNQMYFSPQYPQTYLFNPEYYGITISKYGKLFNMYPNFGLEAGIFYGHEGYKFKVNQATGSVATIRGAEECRFTVVEVPVMAAMHIDTKYFKLVGNLGIYGGYRLTAERSGENLNDDFREGFIENMDRRLDYGLRGALGFGLVFTPIEFHIKANIRYGWGTIFEPDWYSEYYYRFAYPFDIMVTGSLYIQLSKRTGKTKSVLRKEAHSIVYGTGEN